MRNREQMKMLIKERAQVNLSFGIVLDLLECHSGYRRDFFHDQICNQLDCHRCIYSLSAPQAHSMNLKVILKPSPELLNGVMLLPDRYSFTSSQLPSEDHEAFELRAFAVTCHQLCYKITASNCVTFLMRLTASNCVTFLLLFSAKTAEEGRNDDAT